MFPRTLLYCGVAVVLVGCASQPTYTTRRGDPELPLYDQLILQAAQNDDNLRIYFGDIVEKSSTQTFYLDSVDYDSNQVDDLALPVQGLYDSRTPHANDTLADAYFQLEQTLSDEWDTFIILSKYVEVKDTGSTRSVTATIRARPVAIDSGFRE